MRTDFKVGLICVFAVILGVVIYFVAQGQDHPRGARGATGGLPAAASPATPGTGGNATANSARDLAPASATPAAPTQAAAGTGATTQTAAQILQLAQAAPPGAVGGGAIQPPSPNTPIGGAGGAAGGGNFGAPTSPMDHIPALEGGNPAGTGGGGSILPATRPATDGIGGAAAAPGRGYGIDPDVRRNESPLADRPGPGGGRAATRPGTVSHPLAAVPAPGTATVHTIVKGDMLGTIATKYGVTVKAIEAANPGIDSTKLQINQKVNIPAPSAVAATLPATRPAATRPGRVAATGPATTHLTAATGAARRGTQYTVKKGDTLSTIALAAYGDKNAWQLIFRANRGELADPNVVPLGTVLRLPN